MRLSKYLSQNGICSRREAESFIRRGWIKVDGEVVRRLGTTISNGSQVALHPELQKFQASLTTILMNKPVGYVSGQPEKGYKPVLSLLTKPRQHINPGQSDGPSVRWPIRNLAPAGRLDIDSSGLLVFTQDGRIAQRLIAPDSAVEKEYLVRVDRKVTDQQIRNLAHGLTLDDVKLKQAKVELLDADYMRIVLTEGRKRQIRRMCNLVGLEVKGLKRVRIGQVRLGSLKSGMWRVLTQQEKF
ncbi:MAG: pseudouridine synthase [Acidiferrobacterales bacterium]|nr:pseudouridine synthase [Acidiferrobacterales bacterium]